MNDAEVKPADEKQSSEAGIPEVTDLELLDQEEFQKPMEISEESDLREAKREAKKNADVDKLIHDNSDAMQAEFLRGAIPKVVCKHALEGLHCHFC